MKIGVIAAHPDDEILGCGATMAKLASSHDVRILILGEGVTSRFTDRAEASSESLSSLAADARRAAALVGVSSVAFGGLPDNRFDSLPLLEVIKHVESWIAAFGPDEIYTHHPGDLNVDHGVTFRAVLTATRPMAGCTVRNVYAFEVGSSTEWAFQRIAPPFAPTVFHDVSAVIDRKVAAMDAYSSEARPFPHPRSGEAIRAAARRWGSVIGADSAEAFELIRSVR